MFATTKHTSVSIPRVRGVTSRSKRSWVSAPPSPDKIPPCIVTPASHYRIFAAIVVAYDEVDMHSAGANTLMLGQIVLCILPSLMQPVLCLLPSLPRQVPNAGDMKSHKYHAVEISSVMLSLDASWNMTGLCTWMHV
jgi:hypothetical protein